MEKLIELLNEYEQEEGCWRLKYGKLHNKYYDEYDYKDEEIRLISKWYGFIKWLVDNDKIDKDKFICSYEHYISKLDDAIIARLAIQDEPISFLISILK